jgi:hypothetical protein
MKDKLSEVIVEITKVVEDSGWKLDAGTGYIGFKKDLGDGRWQGFGFFVEDINSLRECINEKIDELQEEEDPETLLYRYTDEKPDAYNMPEEDAAELALCQALEELLDATYGNGHSIKDEFSKVIAEVANTAESIGWDMDFEDGYIDLLKRLHDGQCLTVGFPAEGFVDLREGIEDIFDKAEYFGDASPSWSAEMMKIYHALKKIIDPEHKIWLTINPKRLPPARSWLREGPGVDVFSCLFIILPAIFLRRFAFLFLSFFSWIRICRQNRKLCLCTHRNTRQGYPWL